jgi:hypothetical protein
MNDRSSKRDRGTYSGLPPEQQQLLRRGHLSVVDFNRLGVAGSVVDARFEEDERDRGDA